MRAELLIDFVPRDAYLIYGTLNKEWNHMWRQRKFPSESRVRYFTDSVALIKYAFTNFCDMRKISLQLMERGDLELLKGLISLDTIVSNKFAHFDLSKNVIPVSIMEMCDLEFIKRMHEKWSVLCRENFMNAIYANKFEIVRWMYDLNCPHYKTLNVRIRRGVNIDDIGWLLERRFVFDNLECSRFVADGRFDVIKLIHIFDPSRFHGCTTFAYYGRLDMLKWAISVGRTVTSAVCLTAISGNQIEILEWAYEGGIELDRDMSSRAAEVNNFKILKWLYARGCPWGEEICYLAADKNNFEMLRWAHENGCPLSERVHYYAANNNNLEMLKWLHAKGCPRNVMVCANAAHNDNFEMLCWAHDNEYPRDEKVCYYASHNNNLEMLRWALENNYPVGSDVCANAAENNNFEMLRLAHSHGCPLSGEVGAFSARYNNFEMLRWAIQNGCPAHNTVCYYAARNNNFEMLRWARENGHPTSDQVCTAAAHNNNFEMLKWAFANGFPLLSHAFNRAADNANFEILEWLHTVECPFDRFSNPKINSLKWMSERGYFYVESVDMAVKFGRTDILNILTNYGVYMHGLCCSHDLNVIKWAVGNDVITLSELCGYACEHRNFNIMNWIENLGCGCELHVQYAQAKEYFRAY